jgi:hypothetical protein
MFSWRLPAMHALLLFCLTQQLKTVEARYKEVEEPLKPQYVRWIRQARDLR